MLRLHVIYYFIPHAIYLAVSTLLNLQNILWLWLLKLLRNFRQHCRYWGFRYFFRVTTNIDVRNKIECLHSFMWFFFSLVYIEWWQSRKLLFFLFFWQHFKRCLHIRSKILIERKHLFLLILTYKSAQKGFFFAWLLMERKVREKF